MPPPNLLRVRSDDHHSKVTFIELFFDLVFVFAITQLSHTLLNHLDLHGFIHAVMLMMAVWWVWIYTSWVTNWLDPDQTIVRVALLVLMAVGLVLSTSVPLAFDSRGLTFAIAYVMMQVGRSVFTAWAVRAHHRLTYKTFLRITTWFVASGVFWIAGGLAHGPARLALWGIALIIDYAAPAVGYYTPGIGRSLTTDWEVDGAHMAERSGLFVIIALGESILVTGSTFSSLEWTRATVAAASISFLGSVAMWWIYFDVAAETGTRRITRSSDPGRIARVAYTYNPILIVAGIVFTAVGDELLLAHPMNHPTAMGAFMLMGGPAVYLLGSGIFKWMMFRCFPLAHFGGAIFLLLATVFMSHQTAMALAVIASVVLIIVIFSERYTIARSIKNAMQPQDLLIED